MSAQTHVGRSRELYQLPIEGKAFADIYVQVDPLQSRSPKRRAYSSSSIGTKVTESPAWIGK